MDKTSRDKGELTTLKRKYYIHLVESHLLVLTTERAEATATTTATEATARATTRGTTTARTTATTAEARTLGALTVVLTGSRVVDTDGATSNSSASELDSRLDSIILLEVDIAETLGAILITVPSNTSVHDGTARVEGSAKIILGSGEGKTTNEDSLAALGLLRDLEGLELLLLSLLLAARSATIALLDDDVATTEVLLVVGESGLDAGSINEGDEGKTTGATRVGESGDADGLDLTALGEESTDVLLGLVVRKTTNEDSGGVGGVSTTIDVLLLLGDRSIIIITLALHDGLLLLRLLRLGIRVGLGVGRLSLLSSSLGLGGGLLILGRGLVAAVAVAVALDLLGRSSLSLGSRLLDLLLGARVGVGRIRLDGLLGDDLLGLDLLLGRRRGAIAIANRTFSHLSSLMKNDTLIERIEYIHIGST